MHIALYREFRPVTFDELIGQDHIVRILKNQIRTGNTSHAYLFSGTRGTGKTTTARILAKALNCTGEGEKPCGYCESCRSFAEGSFVDVIEMDAASHRGVNDIHEITDSVMYAPAAGKYKVYIIDEVHMLSNEAFNALLKTLEEPPEHVVFILATTEPQKVPATILSRCMKLDFRRVSEKLLVENMRAICEKKGIEAEQGTLSLIAVSADGSVRDSLSILEQCICPGEPLRRDDVAAVLGTAGVEPLLKLTDLVLAQDASGALLCLNDILSSGAETRQFMKEWLEHFRNLLIAKYVSNPSNILNMSSENAERVTEQSSRISRQMLDRAVRELTETISLTKWAKHPRVMLEMAIVKLAAPDYSTVNTPRGASSAEQRPAAVRERAAMEQKSPLTPVERRKSMAAVSSGQGENPESQRHPELAFSGRSQRHPEQVFSSQIPEQPEAAFPDRQPADEPEPARTPEPKPPARGMTEDRQISSSPERDSSTASPSAFSEGDWNHAVEMAAASKGLLTRLTGRTHFRAEQDGRLYITCDDTTTMELLRSRGKETVEQIIQQMTGRPLTIVPEVREPGQRNRKEQIEEEQAQLNLFFGRDVPIT